MSHASSGFGLPLPRDWSSDSYRQMLVLLMEVGVKFRTDWELAVKEARTLYVRHDIDFSLDVALEMAELEYEVGVRATYFVQVSSPLYNPFTEHALETVHRIAELGHPIGLHFRPVSGALRPSDDLRRQTQLLGLAGIPAISVFSIHRPPTIEGVRAEYRGANTYDEERFWAPTYLSDSSGTWGSSAGSWMDAISEGGNVNQLLVHPIWWQESPSTPGAILRSVLTRAQRVLESELETFRAWAGEAGDSLGANHES